MKKGTCLYMSFLAKQSIDKKKMMQLSKTLRVPIQRIGVRTFAATTAAEGMTITLATPHAPIHVKKVVSSIVLPGTAGDYGVTAGHSQLISQLNPGVVSIYHVSGEVEKLFIPGGFALTHINNHTDVSVPEAVSLDDIDASAVKDNYSAALQQAAAAAEGTPAKAIAVIEAETFAALSRAIGAGL